MRSIVGGRVGQVLRAGTLGMYRTVATTFWAPPHRVGGLEGLETFGQTFVAGGDIRVEP